MVCSLWCMKNIHLFHTYMNDAHQMQLLYASNTLLVSFYYGGEGVCGLGDFCGCPLHSEKAKLTFSCQATAELDESKSVLINKPLTHLEKWIKGFVRCVLSLVAQPRHIYWD